MAGQAVQAPSGVRGFDVNATVTRETAAAFHAHGYRFALRYVTRHVPHASDLSAAEVLDLHAAGLAVMAVQHVESESSWEPSTTKGVLYGDGAAEGARSAGLALGTCVWLDLEGVAPYTRPAAVIGYCMGWHARVAHAGYTPSLYVGWHAGLSRPELHRLPFEHYWGAYNLNADQYPSVSGVCMQQHVAKPGDLPARVTVEIDVDTVHPDALGRLPIVCAPDGWLAEVAS
jgi:hypothetical protein